MAWIFTGSLAAGLIGAMLGMGGGIIVVPFLTLLLHVPLRIAAGASIVSVIATSSGAAIAYVRERLTNLRIGMFLEIATTTGAVIGGYLAGIISTSVLYVIFGVMLAYSAYALFQKRHVELSENVPDDPLAERLRLGGIYYDQVLDRNVIYRAAHVYAGLFMMWIAGLVSGLLGIGSGVLKVLAMDVLMQLPMKVSTTTSNFMIGVTAAASAGVYFARGDIVPAIAAPVALGVVAGSLFGTRIMVRLSNAKLRKVFLPVLIVLAGEMILRGFGI